MDASQGTATQLAGLLDDEAGALSPLEPLPPAVELDDDPAPPAAGRADSPPGELGPHEFRLAALIADTALEEANPCKAVDVAVFLDSERLSAVGHRMRAAGQDTTPVPGPRSPEGDGPPPLLAQYAKRTRELLQLVGYTLGVSSFSLSSWEGDAIPAPHPPGLGITVYYVIKGRVQLRLPAPWVVAPGHGICVCLVCPTPAPGGPPGYQGPGADMPEPGTCPPGRAGHRPPPPVQICVKRGDRYTPVDTASMDLGDHTATLTPPGGNPLAIATPMVARATYDRARGGLVIVHSALGAQQLRDAEWKGWSASWVSYARALEPAKPVGFKVLGARAPALRDWVLPRLTGERPAGTPSLTTVFGLIGRDPLLLTVAFPVNRLDKPSPHTVSRTPEYHLGSVALSPADTADFHSSILRRRALDPQLAPNRWLKGLQRAIYDWAHATGRVRALRFRQYRLKTRPAERAPPSRAPQQPFPARSMLPTVGRFTLMAQSILGTSVTAGHALKRSLVALGEARRQQSLRGPKRRALRRKQETLNLKRTPEQWREVQRRSRGPRRDVSEIPLDSKALLNPRETLSALYLSRLRLQGHSYRIRDDPDRWAHFQRYLGLLPQHAPPARGDYVQPRHLWEVQLGKARGPDLRLPEADVCIDIAWYRHLTEAEQKTLCTVVRSPPVSRTVGRRGRVTLLLKNPDQPVQEANLRGITISSHVSKLEPTAFYAVATAVYERALGGMRGISLHEVVRTVHMKLDVARLQNRILDVLITDLAKFFDVIAQDIHPMVGARVGLGEAGHLATHTEGFSYTLPLGPWQSHTLTQLLGTPQGTVQGVHAGATAAPPFLRYMDIAYRSSAVEPFRFPGLMWVDDTIVLLERGDSHPIQGVLLDQRVYYQGILRVDIPYRKIQHGSTSHPRPLRSPTPAAVARHLGRAWVTSTPDQRREALAGAPEIQPSRVLRYMGTDIYLHGAPTAPRNLPEVRAELWTQLRPQRLSPDAAMMVLMAKLPSKLLPLAIVYRPTAKVHAANDALMVRAYKHLTGISRHANNDTLWGPWEHGCQGLTRSEHSWQAAVVREWVRQGAWAKQEFRDSQAYSLQTHQALRGGCPAVLTPGQYTHHPRCPHLIATLQRVVDEVAMPMWMPGQCSGTTPILVRGPGGPRSAAAAAPAPRVEVYTTLYGAVAQVAVPPTVYETVQALGYHHLGDLYTENHQVLPERALKRRAPARKGIPGLRAWLARHAAVLVPLLREPTPRWQAAPKDWIPRAVPTYQAEVIVGGRAAKTTRMETIYHRGQPLRMTAALQDTMETAGWAPEPRVCQQPPGTLPSDTRLHRLVVALLDIQVQVDAPLHAQLWGDYRQESLAQLQRTGVRAPIVVWTTAPSTAAYWNWASTSQAPLVTVTSTLPPFPWIAIAPAAVARFQYPAECMAHKCPGHPHKGPLYYSLDTVGTVPAELHQALRTHLREHHGDMALLAPHGRATSPPRVLAPETRPGVWFHDLPALATLRGSVVAVDAGATQAGMAMAGVVQSGRGEYQAQVASGVGTSPEGEAMALLSYARRLATQKAVYWLVPDSEAAVGALRRYQEGGHYGDGIHHLYATVLGGQRLSLRSAINVVTTPSHWITDLNVRLDAATREPPEADLTWLLRRPYSFIPPVPFRDQCQLSPTALSDWLQDRASIPAQAIYEARWGVNFMPGGALPLDWFDHDQQRHITAHRMDNVPTMAVLAHRSSHRGTVLDTKCLLCGTQPETAPHLWACSAQSHEWGPARRRLAAWLDQKVGPRAAPVRHQLWETTVLEHWAAALRTPSMLLAHLECTGPHSLGREFLRHVVEESIRIWYAHAKARATLLKARLGPGSTMAWAL